MLKSELLQFMDVEQYATFKKHEDEKTHQFVQLPDGRVETWYPDAEVHDWVLKWEAFHEAEDNHLPAT